MNEECFGLRGFAGPHRAGWDDLEVRETSRVNLFGVDEMDTGIDAISCVLRILLAPPLRAGPVKKKAG